MGGNHGLMSKCVLYEPAVRVPLIVRPPGGGEARVVDSLVEHLDIPTTVRAIANAAPIAASEGRSLLGDAPPREVSISENWGFASFETERYKLVVDEDACEPCQLFDLRDDPNEDHDLLPDPAARPTVDELMDAHVRPFLRTTPVRPHANPFA
jgi:choline-sulfatase